MITSTEILEKLRAGKDIETIGNEIAIVLNMANEQYQKEEEEKRVSANKTNELNQIISLFISWYNTYYNPNSDKPIEPNIEDIAAAIINTFDTAKSLSLFGISDSTFSIESTKDFLTLVREFCSL